MTEMLGHGAHDRPAGTVTDDTDLALRIARSLVEQGAFDGRDIADCFYAWYESDPFVIVGLMTADALREYGSGASWQDLEEPRRVRRDCRSAGLLDALAARGLSIQAPTWIREHANRSPRRPRVRR
ncbi:ADP-ribosylglycohydrolase [Halapricum desulfuricans]|uniref:ADP-ribosylglycohydrolase n=1 Tax=Halapricum desulfuricans TaxID=2841257 RepID=A0A897NKH2_9EURY|nr:ADP-ribosylglycohydrolase [Halapricum desulfuricans]